MAKKKTELTFEQKLEKLNELTDSMKDVGIDKMMEIYTQAATLLAECKKTLDGYRAEFNQLSEKNKEEPIPENYEENEDREDTIIFDLSDDSDE